MVMLDYFDTMSAHNLTIVGFQHIKELDTAITDLCSRTENFFVKVEAGDIGPAAWDRVKNKFCTTRELQGGYIELYNLRQQKIIIGTCETPCLT